MNIAAIVLVAVASVCMAFPPKLKEECKKWPKSNPRDCCAMPKGLSDEARKCIEDNKETPEKLPACVFNGDPVITDNEIDRAALLAALEARFTGADAGFDTALHEKVADKCIERSNSFKADEGKTKKFRQIFGLIFCLENEYFKNCPESAWTASDTCTAWKKYVEDCPLFGRRGEKPE